MSESVKAKQAHSTLLSEKQALSKQLQRANTTLDSLKLRIAQCEEQVIYIFGSLVLSKLFFYRD